MFDRLARAWHPEWYHGQGRTQRFFEGWYFKLVDATRRHSLVVIPGVLQDPTRAHAFVQVLQGASAQAHYLHFPLTAFRSERHPFAVEVGANRFSLDRLDLCLEASDLSVHGQVRLGEPTSWPVGLVSPGAMGPFAFVPAMECYHGVLALDAGLSGQTTIGAEQVCWDGGRGYVEKDWGRSFPEAWVWLQCNHFGRPASLTVSIARVPWLGRSFTGLVAGLWLDGRLRRFATYLGSRIEHLSADEGQLTMQLSSLALPGRPQQIMEIEALVGTTGLLHGPTGLDMQPRVPESLTSRVWLKLCERQSGQSRLVFEGQGSPAAVEVVGRTALLAPRGAASSSQMEPR